jgi:hypothetical protein
MIDVRFRSKKHAMLIRRSESMPTVPRVGETVVYDNGEDGDFCAVLSVTWNMSPDGYHVTVLTE